MDAAVIRGVRAPLPSRGAGRAGGGSGERRGFVLSWMRVHALQAMACVADAIQLGAAAPVQVRLGLGW